MRWMPADDRILCALFPNESCRVRAAYEKPDLFIDQPREKPIQEALSFEVAS